MNDSTALRSCLIAADTTTCNADSIEWCPYDNMSHYFVCGTYQLDEKSSTQENQIRHGNIILYKLVSDGISSTTNFNLSIIDLVSTCGVLDMKWNPCVVHDKILLAVATSNGKILLKHLNHGEKDVNLSDLTYHNLAENMEKMVLSIDWSGQHENSASIIASDTKGNINYLQAREADMCLLNSWKAHKFESWIAAFNYFDPNIVYSGGDDNYFKGWDMRDLVSPIFTNKRHTMGVTGITKSKLNENLLVTGSYDEDIFLWDARYIKSPLFQVSVGGGIWRLKWHPTNSQYLLSAAMHNGFHVLSVKSEELEVKISYKQHKSLAYGVDWSHIPLKSSNYENHELMSEFKRNNIKNVIGSCSFYDNLLHVWGINF